VYKHASPKIFNLLADRLGGLTSQTASAI